MKPRHPHMRGPAAQWSLRSLADGRLVPLEGEMVVGREADCDIVLTSRHVSRYQAKLKVTPLGLVVEDLHSTNGTYVNGRRISAPRLLAAGDEVSFYATRFQLVQEEAQGADDTAFDSLGLGAGLPMARPEGVMEPRPDTDRESTQIYAPSAPTRARPLKPWS